MSSTDNTARTSWLMGSNLVSFLPGVPWGERDDILDALLYADLKASAQHDRQTQWAAWIESNRQHLVSCGFALHKMLNHEPLKVSNERGFRQETARLLKSIGAPALEAVATSALDAMFKSSHAQAFFSGWFNFNAGRSDSFQIVPCERKVSGESHIAVCGLQMVTRTRLRPYNPFFPFWPFLYEMTLVLKGASLVYSESAYAPHRKRVREYLLLNSIKNINRVEL